MKTRNSKQVLVGLSVFSDGVLHFLQTKEKFYLFYRNYLVALKRVRFSSSFMSIISELSHMYGPDNVFNYKKVVIFSLPFKYF